MELQIFLCLFLLEELLLFPAEYKLARIVYLYHNHKGPHKGHHNEHKRIDQKMLADVKSRHFESRFLVNLIVKCEIVVEESKSVL